MVVENRNISLGDESIETHFDSAWIEIILSFDSFVAAASQKSMQRYISNMMRQCVKLRLFMPSSYLLLLAILSTVQWNSQRSINSMAYAFPATNYPTRQPRTSLISLEAKKKARPRRSVSFFQPEGTYKMWRERADPAKHTDFMNTSLGGRSIERPQDNLVPQWVYLVSMHVGRNNRPNQHNTHDNKNHKVMVFHGLDQVHQCRSYLSRSPHCYGGTAFKTFNTGWYNPWYQKLPKGLVAKKNRKKALKQLDEILARWETRSPKEIHESLSGTWRYDDDNIRFTWGERRYTRKRKGDKPAPKRPDLKYM